MDEKREEISAVICKIILDKGRILQGILCAALLLALYIPAWYAGINTKMRDPGYGWSGSGETAVLNNTTWNLPDYLEEHGMPIAGRVESADYPDGYNAGVIEDDVVGRAVLLTPGTSISVTGMIPQAEYLNVLCEIHPWVSDRSDGAVLVLSIGGNTYKIRSGMRQQISLAGYQGKELDMHLSVINEEGCDEICDWMVLKDFEISAGKTEPAFSKEGYVTSATYFADEWPINFWNSEMDFLEEDMKQIREDGFDSIILVIPWREFQPDISPVAYNTYAFEKLDEVMRMAAACGLGVYARIGYTWDFYQDLSEDVVDRYCNLLADRDTRDAWNAYLQKMHEVLSGYTCFREAFLTWEDFWNTLGVCDEPFVWSRRKKAGEIGFQDWIKRTYTLKDYNDRYGTLYMDYTSIPVPQRDEPAMEAMYAFYDDFLNEILSEAQEVFPNISMEVRLDWDVVYTKDGSRDYYKHTDTFSCMNSAFTALMYGIPMGFENAGEQVGYQEAMEKTEYMLKQVSLYNDGKPVYIEQFIFADNTPKFAMNARIREGELNDYLYNIADILGENSAGYGIWTYRNYRANMIYNPQFALGGTGWELEGNAGFIKEDGSMACHLEQGGGIRQQIPGRRNHFDAEEYTVEFDIVKISSAGRLDVKVGSGKRSLEVKETGTVCMKFPKSLSFDIGFTAADCDVVIDNLKLYTQVQQGYLYDENKEELDCIKGIRRLNQLLQRG